MYEAGLYRMRQKYTMYEEEKYGILSRITLMYETEFVEFGPLRPHKF